MNNLHIKHAGMLPKVPQELIVSSITLILDFVSYIRRSRLGCDNLYHIFTSPWAMEHTHNAFLVQIIIKVHTASALYHRYFRLHFCGTNRLSINFYYNHTNHSLSSVELH